MSDPVGAATAVAATKAEDTNQIAYWARRWQDGNTQWHKSEVHPAVLAHATTQLECAALAAAVREGRAPASSAPTVLVPLCGKAVDMLYLYQQGFRVVGIEIVTQAIIGQASRRREAGRRLRLNSTQAPGCWHADAVACTRLPLTVAV